MLYGLSEQYGGSRYRIDGDIKLNILPLDHTDTIYLYDAILQKN
jgi:hypothetical protein